MQYQATLAAVVAILGLMAGPAAGSTLLVDDNADPSTCEGNPADFSSIGVALAAAARGDTILVCPGNYAEQLTITTDDVTLRSLAARAAVIRAPARMAEPRLIVRVSGASNVTIRDFTISAGDGCDTACRAIWVEAGGSVTLDGNHIRDLR